MAEQRHVLSAERERLAVVEDRARPDAAQFRQQAAEALTGRQAAETRLADLELLLEQRQTQIEYLHQQRDDLSRERGEAQHHSQTVQQELKVLWLKTERERIAWENYVRGVEDRAHREVDHAREDGKARDNQLKTVGRQVEQLQRRHESLQNEPGQSRLSAAAQQAPAETLEQQLTHANNAAATKRKPITRKPSRRLFHDRWSCHCDQSERWPNSAYTF